MAKQRYMREENSNDEKSNLTNGESPQRTSGLEASGDLTTERELEKSITAMDFADIHGMSQTDKGAVRIIYGTQLHTTSEWRELLKKDFIFNQSN